MRHASPPLNHLPQSSTWPSPLSIHPPEHHRDSAPGTLLHDRRLQHITNPPTTTRAVHIRITSTSTGSAVLCCAARSRTQSVLLSRNPLLSTDTDTNTACRLTTQILLYPTATLCRSTKYVPYSTPGLRSLKPNGLSGAQTDAADRPTPGPICLYPTRTTAHRHWPVLVHQTASSIQQQATPSSRRHTISAKPPQPANPPPFHTSLDCTVLYAQTLRPCPLHLSKDTHRLPVPQARRHFNLELPPAY